MAMSSDADGDQFGDGLGYEVVEEAAAPPPLHQHRVEN